MKKYSPKICNKNRSMSSDSFLIVESGSSFTTLVPRLQMIFMAIKLAVNKEMKMITGHTIDIFSGERKSLNIKWLCQMNGIDSMVLTSNQIAKSLKAIPAIIFEVIIYSYNVRLRRSVFAVASKR